MVYPENSEIKWSLLQYIYKNGGISYEVRSKDTYQALANYFNLTQDEQLLSRDNKYGDGRSESSWNTLVQAARSDLVKSGYLDKSAGRGIWRLSIDGIEKAKELDKDNNYQFVYPEEVDESCIEGAKQIVNVNRFERNPEARKKCIDHYGQKCCVCNFDFYSKYGEKGRDFIHVHHIIPLSSIGHEYKCDPIKDLRPICPNCHAMIHRTNPPCSIRELREVIIN